MVSLSGVTSAVSASAAGKTGTRAIKGLGLGGLVTAGFCLFDFASVPGAFKLQYNKQGEKVEGTNWKSGITEILKSIPKCAQMLVLPALIGAAAAGAGPIVATLAGIASFAAPMLGYHFLDKLLPHEEEVVKQVCEAKGIDITKPDGTPDIKQAAGVLA